MRPHQRYQLIRQGNRVQRWHTCPRIQGETVAQHSAQAAQLLLALFPDASRNVLLAVLHHDIAEGQVGDLAYPAKKRFKRLRQELEEAEATVTGELGLAIGLTEFEALQLRFVDLLECAYSCFDEIRLGNRSAMVPFIQCALGLNAICTSGGLYGHLTGEALDNVHGCIGDLMVHYHQLTGEDPRYGHAE